jgi:hypothetical protein
MIKVYDAYDEYRVIDSFDGDIYVWDDEHELCKVESIWLPFTGSGKDICVWSNDIGEGRVVEWRAYDEVKLDIRTKPAGICFWRKYVGVFDG